MEDDACIICRDSSEFVYRLKQAEVDIGEHKKDTSQDIKEVRDDMEKMEEKIAKRFERLELAIWGIVITSLFVLLDTILGKV